ncbi:DUF1648 domain-containing protein [Staphylococcus hyicus]|uniref:DUF1648 domain-containing protein n=1 Tax=Staphylococcus hyicus TaxID=1284 RepID=UPI00211CBCD7|nr:DUF1648 domain-containing protein [Staphylococcus hyicus]MCQ9291189.1 DUF1648 domain-containing protein [Staphylococcus hyicus]MCQ9306430.1 DUF1648 domain-containing protein [Staphylococcus hyicus]MCQ9308843.1 DUF1648 domain-containing protein [Staphylococcus hyicus]MCQ9311264.1 DUF1648 domain-containing protein [Staphylococcus hyicus]
MNYNRYRIRILNGFCLIIWLIALSYLGFMYDNIPNKVGTHFTLLGQADAYGDKVSLWLLPVTFMVIWVIGVLFSNALPTLLNLVLGVKQSVKTQQCVITGFFSILHLTTWMLYMNLVHHALQGEHKITVFFTILPIVSVSIYIILVIGYGLKQKGRRNKLK